MKQMPALPNAELLALLKKTLARGAPFRFTATGSSMIPFVRDGDEITVSPLGGAAPRIGDVVALRRRGAGGLLVHRIVAVRIGSFLTRGDNSSADDGEILPSEVLGRVTGISRGGLPLRLGLGPERRLIAAFSRVGALGTLLSPLARLHRLFGYGSGRKRAQQ